MSRVVHGIRSHWGGGRPRRKDTVAFVLGGGGVLGAIQVGQAEALLRAGIVPDLLVGTSVGALNAASIAADPTVETVERMRDVWLGLESDDIFPGSRLQRAWHFVRKGDHLYPNSGIRSLIAKIPAHSFEQLARPLTVVSANLRSGQEQRFTAGRLEPAILSSTALPGVFPPVLVDGELYVDGGIVNNVPISAAVDMGATKIYVLTCGGARTHDKPIRRPLEVLLQAFAHSRQTRFGIDIERYAQSATIHMLPTVETPPMRFDDTSHSRRLYAEAFERTSTYLAGVPAVARAHA